MNQKLFVPVLVFALTTLTAAAALAQAPNRAAVEKQIVANERAVNDAFAKGDMKVFKDNLAPDAVSLDGGGISKVITADFEKMMKSAKIQTWNIDGSQFYWVNDTTVLHMYRWTGKGTFEGQPIPSPTWASSLWTNKGGKWLAVFHQETTAMAPPPPAATTAKPPAAKK